MSTDPQPESPSPKPRKPFLRPSRIVLWIIILAAIVVAALEYRAQSAWKATYMALDEALVKANETGKPFCKPDVNAMLRGSPKREPALFGEVLTWTGVLKSYRVSLEYGEGDMIVKLAKE
jgi:hypothetical protein